MIKVYRGRVEETADKAVMVTPVAINDNTRLVRVSVDKQFGKFLSPERADYALTGLVSYAMLHGHDLTFEAPVTEELLYNVKEILVPSLCRNDPRNYHTQITAEMAPPLEKVPISPDGRNGVGTGMSCGVDSFHVLAKHLNSKYPHQKLTHLTIFNVGAINSIYREAGIADVRQKIFERAAQVAAEVNLPLIQLDSNFHVLFRQNHLHYHSFMDAFAMYSLQKLWKVYYYASGYPFEKFKLADNSQLSGASYDLLLLNRFSTSGLRIYCSGAETDRNHKVKFIADFPPAQKHLHVCIRQGINCGWCKKCLRTMLSLDAIDKLDNFNQTFNVDNYRAKAGKVYRHLCRKNAANDLFYTETYAQLYPRHKEQFDAINKALAAKSAKLARAKKAAKLKESATVVEASAIEMEDALEAEEFVRSQFDDDET